MECDLETEETKSGIHVCAYCGKEYKAAKPFSHIVPKQFFKRFKRGINNKEAYSTYHKRKTQREPVEYLLCHDCEHVFGEWESALAANVTNKLDGEVFPEKLTITKEVKLAALSVLWRIMHCWAVNNDGMRGTLNESDVSPLSNYENKWFGILKERRDFSKEEANIFIIPVACVSDVNNAIIDYKKYPGILANIVFHDQGDSKGFICVRCLAYKVLIFAYLTPLFTLPKDFSIHNNVIEISETIMPPAIECIFTDYVNGAAKVDL